MHRTSGLLVGALVLLVVPSVVGASTLSLQPSTFSITIGALPPVTLPNNPTSIVVSSGSGTFTEPAGAFGPADVSLPVSLFTGVSLISGLTLVGFGNGTVVCDGFDPELTCAGGLAGTTLVNVLQLFNLSIPLSVVGSPGATVKVDAGGIVITVTGQRWIAGPTSVDFGTGVAFSNGEDNRRPDHGGPLVLVSGFRAVTNVAGTLPGFAVQTLEFAPEPGGLLLIAVGVGGFGLYALARRRR